MQAIYPENGIPKQILEITLDGAPYLLHLDWSDRASLWIASLYLPDESPIFEGQAVRTLQPLLTDTRKESPRGFLAAIPLSPTLLDPPGLNGWGVTHRIGFFY